MIKNSFLFIKQTFLDNISAQILSQYKKLRIFQLIVFYLKKHNLVECNYKIYNKKLMAIIRTFEHWYSKFEGSAHFIKVVTNYKNL